MFSTFIIVTILTIIANIFSAVLDFIRFNQVLINMQKANVPDSWISVLGTLKAAGAVGLVVGFFIPQIGVLASIGLILFFISAIITHLRVRDYSFGLAIVFLFLAVSSFVLRIIYF